MINIFSFFLLVLLAATQPWQAHGEMPISAPQTIIQLEKTSQRILTRTATPVAENALVEEKGRFWVTILQLADLKTNRPATSQTMFSVGFTSLAFLKLQEEDCLKLKYKLGNLAQETKYENHWKTTFLVDHLSEYTTGCEDLHLPSYLA